MKSNDIPPTITEHSPFWVFSCTVYQQQTIANAALHFQNQWGLSINFLLFCSFCSLENKQLTQPATKHLWQQLSRWNKEYTLQIRNLRQKLKLYDTDEGITQLYQSIKQIELLFEYQEQQILFKQFGKLPQTNLNNMNDLFITNVSAYLKGINQSPLANLLAELSSWFDEIKTFWALSKKQDA